jgi:hypothetical protein
LSKVDLAAKALQESILHFARETHCLRSVEGIDLFALRDEVPVDAFSKALCNLTTSQIELLGNFKKFATRIKSMNSEGFVGYVQSLTNSGESFLEIKAQVRMIMREINDKLPFIFLLKIVRRSELTVLQVQDTRTILENKFLD